MKTVIHLLAIVAFFNACSTTKSYSGRGEKDLQSLISKINTHPADKNSLAAFLNLYSNIQQDHLKKIKFYSKQKDLSRWDNIIIEYNALQSNYDFVQRSSAATLLVSSKSYTEQIQNAKRFAAEEYYISAQTQMEKHEKKAAKRAYDLFAKANQYYPNYKDVQLRIKESYQMAVINVIIDTLRTSPLLNVAIDTADNNNSFAKSILSGHRYTFRNDFFQQKLIADLKELFKNSRYLINFYTEKEAVAEHVRVDWVVDLELNNVFVPLYSSTQVYATTSPGESAVFVDQQVHNSTYARRVENDDRITYTGGEDLLVIPTVNVDYHSVSNNYLTSNAQVFLKKMPKEKNINSIPFEIKKGWQYNESKYAGKNDINDLVMMDIMEDLYTPIYRNMLLYTMIPKILLIQPSVNSKGVVVIK